MLKVLKFGGSSMADEKQFAKVRDIVRADDSRRVVVVSAAGKREKNDHKITDLLYLCHAHLQYGVSCDGIYDMIRSRYVAIRDALGLKTPLEAEFAALREKLDGVSHREKFRLRCYNGDDSYLVLEKKSKVGGLCANCLLYTSPSPRDS